MTDHTVGEFPIDTSKPHSARIFDYFLGGENNYLADREAGERMLQFFSKAKAGARANRDFLHRAVRHLARSGVHQFLDIGAGIPTQPNLHNVVQSIAPRARVVYADNDPLVLRYADALLTGTPEGRTDYLHADFREPAEMIRQAARTLDLTQPVAVSLVALLHFISDEDRPHDIIRQLMAPLAPGSHLVLTHGTTDFAPQAEDNIVAAYRSAGMHVVARSRDHVARCFDGLELIEPGIVPCTSWYPGSTASEALPPGEKLPLYAAVARKPSVS